MPLLESDRPSSPRCCPIFTKHQTTSTCLDPFHIATLRVMQCDSCHNNYGDVLESAKTARAENKAVIRARCILSEILTVWSPLTSQAVQKVHLDRLFIFQSSIMMYTAPRSITSRTLFHFNSAEPHKREPQCASDAPCSIWTTGPDQLSRRRSNGSRVARFGLGVRRVDFRFVLLGRLRTFMISCCASGFDVIPSAVPRHEDLDVPFDFERRSQDVVREWLESKVYALDAFKPVHQYSIPVLLSMAEHESPRHA